MPTEITITVKDDSNTYKENHLDYEAIAIDPESPSMQILIRSALEKFPGDKTDPEIVVRTKTVIR